MNVTDPISDMLTRVRNASRAGLEAARMPHSKMKAELARVLKQEGFIADFKAEQEDHRRYLNLRLRYGQDRQPLIRGLRRISKPGLRRYVGAGDIPRVLGGMGVAVLSTSRGLLTDREARKAKLGGELVCYIW
jgi:small subunit ribosomal protein S8